MKISFIYNEDECLHSSPCHCEKLCPQKLDSHATKSSQKLLCNQGTTTLWKYNELIIKMSS